MNAILKVLLEVTVYSSVIAGILLLLRALFKKKISAKLQYMAWLLLIVRLMIPVTVESGVHFFTIKEKPAIVETVPQETQTESKSVVEAPAQTVPKTAPTVLQGQTPQAKPQMNITVPAETAKKLEIHITWQQIVVGLWIMGAVALGGFFLRTRVRFMRKIKATMQQPTAEMQWEYDRICEEMMLREAPELIVCDVQSPALMGSKVLIPEGISGQTMRYALYHELTHYRRKDHIMVVLMSALRCVYWFNPLVWIAFRAMQTDMEVACDAGVMERIGAEEKRGYLTTLLNMFSAHSIPAIGMAQAQSKNAAKERIEGAFRKTRTGRTMRMVSAIAACMILVCCFTTACQPTPEKPIVVNKNDGKLEEKIAAESVVFEEEAKTLDVDESQLYYLQEGQSALAKSIGAPEHWNVEEQTYKIPFGTLNLTVDADVHIPDAKAEVDTVDLQVFTAEEQQAIIDTFFGDKDVYIEDQTWTKDDYIKSVEAAQLQLQHVEREMTQNADLYFDPEAQLQEARETLAQEQAALAKAPDEKNHQPYTGQKEDRLYLCTLDEKGNVADRLNLYSLEKDEEIYHRGNSVAYSSAELVTDGWDTDMYLEEYHAPETAEQERAVAIALDAAKRLQAAGIGTGTDVICTGVHVVKNTIGQEVATKIQLYPAYGGLPSYQFWWGFGNPYSAMESGENLDQYSTLEPMERIHATVVDGKLMSFIWDDAQEIKQTENKNAALLPFEEIKEIFLDNIRRNIYAEEGEDLTMIVSDIYLSTMLVPKKDSEDYYTMPVWDFMVYSRSSTGSDWFDHNQDSILTINALDGSIIRRMPSALW